MFIRYFCALAVLALLAGCATTHEPRSSQPSHAVMPATVAATRTATEPVPATSSPMAIVSLPAPPAVESTVTAAKPAVPHTETTSKSAMKRRHVARVKPKTTPSRDATRTAHKTHKMPGAAIRGQVMLAAAAGQAVSAADMSNTLVYFVPDTMKTRPHPGQYTIYTNHHQFQPGAMAVPLGSTVHFVNLDSVDHNVFSVTPGNRFNLGYQSHGQTTSHTFDHAGLVLISCNVHPSMEVDLLVEPSPYTARVGADGRFILHDIPAGSGTLHAWNPRAGMASRRLSLPQSAPVQMHLTITRPMVETDLNMDHHP